MKIAFMGSDPIVLPMLDFLQSDKCADADIVVVLTQPDRKTGRGMRLQANEIKKWAEQHSIEILQPLKCGQTEADYLHNEAIDLVIVMAYGQILPRCILEVTQNKVLNMHASLLPRFRGASPIHTAVALGLEKTGVSLMEIIPKLDAGPVADFEEVLIGKESTVVELMDLMAQASVALVQRGLDRLVSGNLEFVEQDLDKVTYCRIIDKNDRHLDFNRPATDLHNRIRAFQPWPGTAFPVGDLEIRIVAGTIEQWDENHDEPGTVRLDTAGMTISCGQDLIRPRILQRPGGKPLPVNDFLRGFPIIDGSVLLSREMRPLEGKSPFPYRKK